MKLLPEEVNWTQTHNNISAGKPQEAGAPQVSHSADTSAGLLPGCCWLKLQDTQTHPAKALNCARFLQQVIKDGSTTLRVSHLSYSSEGISTLVKTWRGANLKSAPSFLLQPAVPALILLLMEKVMFVSFLLNVDGITGVNASCEGLAASFGSTQAVNKAF